MGVRGREVSGPVLVRPRSPLAACQMHCIVYSGTHGSRRCHVGSRMEAIWTEALAASASDQGISARAIVQQHRYSLEALARPAFNRLSWGAVWFVGEAPKRSHLVICPTFSRLANLWSFVGPEAPVEFRDLTSRPMPKSRSRWGDVRPRRLDAALGARRLLREALGLAGAATGNLFVVLLGSTVREACGARRLEPYCWHRLPRCRSVMGELFLAAIPHPSPLASRAFDRVAQLLAEMRYARFRPFRIARDCGMIDDLPLPPLRP